MSGRTDFDLLRDYAAGRLAPADRRAFEARMAAEPELAALAEDWAAIAALPDPSAPAPTLGFEDLPLAAPAPLRRLAWGGAIAAGLLAAALLLLRGDREPAAAVRLAAVPLEAPPVAAPALPLPEGLSSYAGPIEGIAKSRAFSRFTDRPALFLFHVPGCPICKELLEETFPDPRMRAATEPFVLATVPYSEETVTALLDGASGLSWPIFVVEDPEGRRVDILDGEWRLEALERELRLVADRFAKRRGGAPRPWEETVSLARDLEAAAGGAVAARLARYERILAADPRGPLGAVAREGVDRIRREAYETLAAIRSGPADRIVEALSAARDRFQGTEYGNDFARLLGSVERTGRFPALEANR